MRKALYLGREADVVIIDRNEPMAPEGICCMQGEASANLHLIDQADLVVAATGDPAADEMICQRAIANGIPYNRSDGPGGFLIPSVVNRRNYTVAVSTLGRSPGMSRHIRLYLEEQLPRVFEDMVDLTEVLREELKGSVPDPADREGRLRRMLENRSIWEALMEDPVRALVMAREVMR